MLSIYQEWLWTCIFKIYIQLIENDCPWVWCDLTDFFLFLSFGFFLVVFWMWFDESHSKRATHMGWQSNDNDNRAWNSGKLSKKGDIFQKLFLVLNYGGNIQVRLYFFLDQAGKDFAHRSAIFCQLFLNLTTEDKWQDNS